MSYNLKTELQKQERFAPGHRMCAGCGSPIAVRTVLRALEPEDRAVVCCATGCLQVSGFIFPYPSWEDSYIHTAFENAGATISGVETAYHALKKRGKIDENFKFIAFGGDGGTYDIDFQSLSGAMERGQAMVCLLYTSGRIEAACFLAWPVMAAKSFLISATISAASSRRYMRISSATWSFRLRAVCSFLPMSPMRLVSTCSINM